MNEQPQLPSINNRQPNQLGSDIPTKQHQNPDDYVIEWQASEYIHHSKGIGWLVAFAIIVIALVILTLFMQVYTFTFLTVVMGIAFLVFAFRQPHILQYRLDNKGLYVQGKFYSFSDFKAFGILQDGAIFSIILLPAKRLLPAISMYFEEKDGEAIVDAIGQRLPQEPVKLDLIDLLMRRLHF